GLTAAPRTAAPAPALEERLARLEQDLAKERAALVGRTLPTPTWPAGLAWQPAGAVVLLFYVRADGTLADVRVEMGSGLATLDEHVRAFVARTWSFEPTPEPRWARNRFVVAAPR
ncbi:MAG: energy transducer TonB, partial [Planctomycetia bacterium]